MKEYRQQEGPQPNLRHRLVGALVLVALAAIVVPLVLDFNAEQFYPAGRDNIPEQPEDFRIEEVPLVAAGDAGTPEDGARAGAPAVPADAAAGKPPAWVVQVGSFSSEDNARTLRDQLRAQGYKAVFIDREVKDGKPVLRVRIGPEMERARSEQMREKLARDMKLEAVVISYDWRGSRAE
ncbi:MAG: SPOR domain-containing protein [Gammaproteobacteria bacterium]|nr:SPOR domain-containing protein [Gammaproteobacteria bacterium]